MLRTFRALLRLAEALLLSVFAGLFAWIVPALFLGTYVPLVCAAGLGFLAGGAVTLRTLGVEIASRRLRMAVAVVCATAAYAALQSKRLARTLQLLVDAKCIPPYLLRGLARTTLANDKYLAALFGFRD